MKPEFWLERWRNKEIGFHQQDVNAELQAHWEGMGVPAGARVFVPLCGKSRDMLWLRAQGHAVIGCELSQIAVREFFAENGLEPEISTAGALERWSAEGVTILCGDLFALRPADLEGVAGVYDRAALVALPPEMRRRYADKMRELLPPGAAMLLITWSYPEGEMQGPPFSVSDDEVHRLYAEGFDVVLLSRSDASQEDERLRKRGLTSLVESLFQIRRRAADGAISRA